MTIKIDKSHESLLQDILEMITGFENGTFSKTFFSPKDSQLELIVEKLNQPKHFLIEIQN